MTGHGVRLGDVLRPSRAWLVAGCVLATADAAVAVGPRAVAAPARNGVIAYTVGNGDETPYAIKVIRPDGTGDRRLLGPTRRFDTGAANAVWSKDGRRLLFARLSNGPGGGLPAARALWTADPRGRHLHRIPLHLGLVALWGFDWSPDGRRVVFAAGRDASRRPLIYTITVKGTHRRTVRRGWSPTWSPRGRHIAFLRVQHRGAVPGRDRARIGIMRPDGTRLRLLTPGRNDSEPAFSPDGRSVVYVRNYAGLKGEQWRIIDVDGSGDRLLRTLNGASNTRYCAPQWSPDGRRLAAIRTVDGPTDNDPSIAQFTTVDRSGGDERVAFTFPMRNVLRYSMCDFSWRPRPHR